VLLFFIIFVFGAIKRKRDKNNNNNKENKIKNMQLGIKLKEIIKKNGYNWQKNKMNLETKL
jgi:hypothetical protein